MAPINKKFRAVDALKNSTSSSSSPVSPPSSPSISSPPSVIRNHCQKLEKTNSGPYSSDAEQVDPRINLSTNTTNTNTTSTTTTTTTTNQPEKRKPLEVDFSVVSKQQQDLPIDATIGATFDTLNILSSDSTSNDSIVTSTQTLDNNNHHCDVNNPLILNDQPIGATLFSPISPPSPFQRHSQEINSALRRNHSQQQQQQQQQQYHELHSESSHNPEPLLHHQIRNRLHLHPQHLNLQNHLKDHHPHPHHSSSSSNIFVPNHHCIIPSPSNSPFDQSIQPHVHQFTFPFSPTSSSLQSSLPPSPVSVITENVGHSKDSFSSEPVYSCNNSISDSNGIRTRADNSNSEPFPREKSNKIKIKQQHSSSTKLSLSSPPPPSSSSSSPSSSSTLTPSETNSHRNVSFKMDYVSPSKSSSSSTTTPPPTTNNSEGHKSSSSGKGIVDKESEEYRLRRERNNIAVRKSRSKSKVKFIQTIDRMNQLEEENSKLHARIDEMSKEVTILRLLVARYHREDPRRLEHLEHLLAIEMSQEITTLGRFPVD